jgi:hypothetical protein
MFLRPHRRSLRRAMRGEVPPALRRANELMAAGEYAAAAEIFEQFGRGGLARNGPRAPWFFLQAGRARLLAGEVPAGMALLHPGLSLLAGAGQFQQLQQTGRRAIAELNERGLAGEAKSLEDYLHSTLPGGFQPTAAAAGGPARPVLPVSCPGCGGPVRSDEVDWIDERTAECPYCGGALRAEA